ncbi:MAG: hypothetical protein DI535_26190 [Citrobacter freundii]|nr:MAG: hypothetical protein DI535_26190 [Citrobacter freundii]
MRKHNGMRPQDVVILLKIIAKSDKPWQNKDLAAELFISSSEISESLYRSSMAGLIDADKRKIVYKQNLMEFLEHGLHYVFPVEPSRMENGLYTAHSHPYMREQIKSESLAYVWPDPRGDVRGLAIEPLYQHQVKAAQQDEKLYLMLALLDVIRVGRVRELKIAVAKLKELLA